MGQLMAAYSSDSDKISDMSASNNELTIHLLHDNDVSKVLINLNDGVPSVGDFANLVAETTGIPVTNQRLIYKGKSLTDTAASLQSYGVRSGSKVMVLGSKAMSSEDAEKTKVMNNVEDHVTAMSNRLADLTKQYNDIKRGFLVVDLQGEALTKLGRQLVICIEEFTKDLEKLDGLSLSQSIESIRNRRKTIVVRIQSLLVEADSLHSGITDLKSRVS